MAEKGTERKRAIVITAFKEIMPAISAALDRYSIDIVNTYDSLRSLSVIKKAIARTGNTVFLRKAFSRFVNECGPPDILIIDEKANLGSDSSSEPDMRKLLRTFLISFIIMQKTYGERARANIVLIHAEDVKGEEQTYETEPTAILNFLSSQNDSVNKLIEDLKKQPERFHRSFAFKAISKKIPHKAIAQRLSEFIEERLGLTPQEGAAPVHQESPAVPTAPRIKIRERAKGDACTVVMRTSDSTIMVNGVEKGVKAEGIYRALPLNETYVLGSWSTRNQKEIADSLRKTLQRGADTAGDDSPVLTINLTRCEIDPAIISSLVDIATNSLPDSIEVKISVNFKSALLLENAPGYIMIRNHIHHAY